MLRPLLLALAALLSAAVPVPVRAGPPGDIDYSHAGYGGGGIVLPDVPVRIQVEPTGGDDTRALQDALDAAARLPLGADGFRGAVVLLPGTFQVSGTLVLHSSGVVLRGEGATLVATGNRRRTLISVQGSEQARTVGAPVTIVADVPAGSFRVPVADTRSFAVGQRVLVRRPSTAAWIRFLGMDQFTGSFKDQRLDWKPGSRDVEWERRIIAIDPSKQTLSLDAPLTTALDASWGGGTVHVLEWPDRLTRIGVEHLHCVSAFDPLLPADEEHAWICISLDQVEDAWVREVTATHFAGAAVWIGRGGRAITVADVRSEKPVSENAGWRRHAFYTRGQQVLFLRCVAEDAREAFVAGHAAAGPTVFLECTALRALADSGGSESWASGVLFDGVRVEGARLVLGNVGERGQGAGWNMANSLAWHCQARELQVASPPGATNARVDPPRGDAAAPPVLDSHYRRQLAVRLGERGLRALAAPARRAPVSTGAGVATARGAAMQPGTQEPPSLPTPADRPATAVTAAGATAPAPTPPHPVARTLTVQGGQLLLDGEALLGTASSNAWWKGQTVPARAAELGYHPARWVPGLTGPGLTEDLAERAQGLVARDARLVQVWPGLWYDRRRDDHRTVERADADAWAPFFEMPWARSGNGQAADGLSKYDLTRFNPWYFERLKGFAAELGARGGVLYHHLYNHHNLVEAAAHWTDFPWRSANCLQDTGFTEPPPYTEEGRRIGIVAEFYDTTHPLRRTLHRLYIRQCLDAFQDTPNVIHTAGFQFAGPLSFQQFFLDTVDEWQRERGRRVCVALNTSKAITDAILDDPARAALVSVVDQRYWQYLAGGELFAPHSDGAQAFREQRVAAFGKDRVPVGTPEGVYRQVADYRDRFPEKVVLCGHAGKGPMPVLMAGGYPLLADYAAAQPLKPERDDPALFAFLRREHGRSWSQLRRLKDAPAGLWALAGGGHWLLYSETGDALPKPAPLLGRAARGNWFNPADGTTRPLVWTTASQLAKPTAGPWLLSLHEE